MFKIIFEAKYSDCDASKRIIFILKELYKTVEFVELPILNNGRFSNKTNKVFFCGIDVYSFDVGQFEYNHDLKSYNWRSAPIKI